ncbi:Lysine--tRNA ligase, cytoplasmic, partial [Linum grandiflorum]
MEGMDEAVQADLQVNPKEATSKNARKNELIGNKQREEERKRKEEERARKRGTTQFFDLGYAAKFRGLANGEHVKDVTISLAGRVISKPSSSSKLFLYDMYGDD